LDGVSSIIYASCSARTEESCSTNLFAIMDNIIYYCLADLSKNELKLKIHVVTACEPSMNYCIQLPVISDLHVLCDSCTESTEIIVHNTIIKFTNMECVLLLLVSCTY
jgi:hypothetical protein